MIDGEAKRVVRSRTGQERLFINVTTVLPGSGHVDSSQRQFRDQRGDPSTHQERQDSQYGKIAA